MIAVDTEPMFMPYTFKMIGGKYSGDESRAKSRKNDEREKIELKQTKDLFAHSFIPHQASSIKRKWK